ncbi:glycosyltransferase [Castellaniella caeni]
MSDMEHENPLPAPDADQPPRAAAQGAGAALPDAADESAAQPPLQVVHVISGLLHGGAETVLQRLVTAPGGTARHTVVSMTTEGVIGVALREAGVEVVTLDMQGAVGSLRGLWRLYRLLRARRPDVVQTWMYHADLIGGLVARLAGIRALAWGVRNSGVSLAESSRSSRATAWLCARVSGWLPGVIVVCARKAAQVHRAWGYRADRVLVVPNGYDFSRWHPDATGRAALRAQWGVSDDAVVLGCVARWNPLKDHANLLAALALSLQADARLRCVLIGLGMSCDNAELIALARQYGVLDQLIFLGRRDDVPALMRGLDVHVLSSKAEGFPNVVCEAMASGAACVVTDVGDAADIVADHGWVAPAQNPSALSQAIGQAVVAVRQADWPARREAARASVAQRYGLQTMVERYQTVWARLAADYPADAGVAGRLGRWLRVQRAARVQPPATGTAVVGGEQAGVHGGMQVSAASRDGQAARANQAPRLLFFITNPAFLVSHRLPLAIAARDAGYDVHVASMGGPAVAQLEALGLTHHTLPLSRTSMRPWTEARSFWAIWRLLRRLRPAVVHAVTLKSVLYGGIACRLARVPAYVVAISGLGYVFIQSRDLKRRVLRRLALVLYRLALGHARCRVIFQNPSDRDMLMRAGAVRPGQVVMIRGSGVDLGQFSPRPLPDGPVVVAMAARLLRDKGVEEFVAAARLSAARGGGVIWRLAGSPDLENPASVQDAQLQAWQREGVIDYVGECHDVAAFYAGAHIVTLPSYREGLPKSLIEAAACGRPVVTTDVPGCRDVIEPGVSGLLVPARDAQALADAVARLAADADLRTRMGAAGRALAERDFGLQGVVQAHLAVYDELSGKHPL